MPVPGIKGVLFEDLASRVGHAVCVCHSCRAIANPWNLVHWAPLRSLTLPSMRRIRTYLTNVGSILFLFSSEPRDAAVWPSSIHQLSRLPSMTTGETLSEKKR